MIEVRCIGKLRDKHNRIYGYTLQDGKGQTMNVQANALKNAIRAGQVDCINLTLTDDNRLVDKAPTTNGDKQATKTSNDSGILRIKGIATPPSMYGIAIKGIKTLKGREGEFYCGSVYKNDKKLGDWSQSPYGAIVDDYYFDETELDDAVKQWSIKTEYNGRLDRESFMLALVVLTEYYSIYKKAIKNGRDCLIIITDEYDMSYRVLQCNTEGANRDLPGDIHILINKYKADVLKSGYKPVVKIFKSSEDFIIR